MKELRPIGIRADSSGVYIRMEELFVMEKGVFVPFDTREQLSEDGDPSYEIKFQGIYFYKIQG